MFLRKSNNKIKADDTDPVVSEIIKVYPEQNSASTEIFIEILNDVISFAKEADEQIKGLVLWSHGSAWLPYSNILNSERASTAL